VVPRKGVHLLRRALALIAPEFPELRLVVAGNNDPPATEYERTELAALREMLGDRLEVVGRIPHERLLPRVASATVLVAPSLCEFFGNQAVESILLGTPVVATAGTGMSDLIERVGGGTVVQRDDVAGFGKAVAEHLRAGGSGCSTARERLREEHSARAVTERLLDIYREVLGTPG
jgi:glycosyltransferase involved in cell wall biosynthesis